MDFSGFFSQATGGLTPYPYQRALAEEAWPDLLEVPTGLGKTAAVTLSWLWKRGWRGADRREAPDQATPRRLVWCLPMRVLVEQGAGAMAEWLARLGLEGRVRVHRLMGGESDTASWLDEPEHDAILVGTQDMLLSRALMRGYGVSRYRWPMDFALLHNDAFWVFDEVQLMGPGMATSAQLEAFRRLWNSAVPCRSLWLSATLRRDWLETVDLRPHLGQLRSLTLGEAEKAEPAVQKRYRAPKALRQAGVTLDAKSAVSGARGYLEQLARQVAEAHQPGSTTLVVLNTVERAQGLYRMLEKVAAGVPRLLVHARFRGAERAALNRALMGREAGERIVVATQAVEAGVDLSAATLFTELAPWSSLVQRFGRCNRYGEFGEAAVYWIDIADEKLAVPYEAGALSAARNRLQGMESASAAHLPGIEEEAVWEQVIRRGDFLDLFDTDPDLSGFDLDVSPYIRDADDRDLLFFWRDLKTGVEEQPAPASAELCRAGLTQAKKLLDRLRKAEIQAWHWDFLERRWRPWRGAVRPGLVLMLPVEAGGYDSQLGLLAGSRKPVSPLEQPAAPPPEADEDERLTTIGRAVTLDRHLCDAAGAAEVLCHALGLESSHNRTVVEAARWHDAGKAHAAFQNMIRAAFDDARQAAGALWAKSPGGGGRPAFRMDDGSGRPHFRHELASMLAWLAHRGEAPDADLTAYLILAHHGKLRLRLRALPGEREPEDGRLFCRGVWAGDRLPAVATCTGETLPGTELALELMQLGEGPQGASWTARTGALLETHGPFVLAWLETLVRLADWRASRRETEVES